MKGVMKRGYMPKSASGFIAALRLSSQGTGVPNGKKDLAMSEHYGEKSIAPRMSSRIELATVLPLTRRTSSATVGQLRTKTTSPPHLFPRAQALAR